MKKPLYQRWWIWALLVLLVIAYIVTPDDTTTNIPAADSTPPFSINSSPAPTPKATPEPTPIPTIEFTAVLTNGNYTVGIDIPAGKYDITALSGSGSVRSSDLFAPNGISTTMGVGSEAYCEEYKNVELTEGIFLSVSGGVEISIYCDKASGEPLKERIQPNTETISLGSGNFVAGEDFPAGIYDIVATSGSGTVSSDNWLDGGIWATMGVEESVIYEKEYKNIMLSEGVALTIERVNIDLIPSK